MWSISSALESVARALENTTALDPPADQLQKITGALPPGKLKDLLSGTPLGHPAHPLLVTIPIGAFSCAAVLDLSGGNQRAARQLVGLGILASLPAAACGTTDWSDTRGAERRVGLTHAVLNGVALVAMTKSWLDRRSGTGTGKVALLAGLSLISASGWLGGHLSYAMGVGVDTTAFSRPPTDWAPACELGELTEGQPHGVTVEGLSVLLVRRGATVHAMANRCTHRGAPLDEGPVIGDCIECPWHLSRFKLADGAVARGPATRPQPSLEVRIVGDQVEVRRQESRTLRTNPV